MTCTSSCTTRDHATMGECLRSKGVRVAYCNSANNQDYTAQKKWDRNLDAYRELRKQGVQPSGSSPRQVRAAEAISDMTGEAYKA